MKVEPRELLNVIADATKEIVEEQTDLSAEALVAMKLIVEKVKNKLFILEVSDSGLSVDDINRIINNEVIK